jgi:phenylalanyl-tRNA synthetase beta chain
MKVSLNWLREFIELPPTVPALVDLLTLAGVEVEDVITTGCSIPNVIVAQIDESVQHPNADRLSVCKVNDGTGSPRQIVCGAKNYKVGDKVPLALPGAKLPGDFTIKASRMRGVESNGMLCSGEELGIPDDADGLLILPPDSKIGAPIADLYPGDTVLDLEITPNRPDLLSMSGIVREISALTGKMPTWPRGPRVEIAQTDIPAVAVETTVPCYYSARHIRGVKVGPSPDWLRHKLEAVGLRAINNVVDVTNFVMLSNGQPLHAFDAAKLNGSLRVRNARDGETFLALDGKTYQLSATDLVIADAEKAVAIAGIMGGEETGVTAQTTDVVLECAYFDPATIRRTARRLGLSSDSSYRFERKVDMTTGVIAGFYAARLIGDLAGARLVSEAGTASNDSGLAPSAGWTVALRTARVSQLLGTSVSDARIDEILTHFGLQKTAEGWRVPTSRPDLTREVDLIEEIARVVGMDAVPARTQARFAPASATDRNYDRAMALRRAFAAQGLHESRSITLTPAQPLGLACTQVALDQLVRVKNPMIDEQVTLRPNLLHGLLTAVRENFRAGAQTVRLFEIGRVFNVQRPEEFSHAAFVLAGPLHERSWRAAEGRTADVFDVKAILTAILGRDAAPSASQTSAVAFDPEPNPGLALSIAIKINGQPVGLAGQLWPADARALDASVPVVFATLDLTALAKAAPEAPKKYRDIPRFPATTRDIAMLAPLTLTHAEVAKALASAHEPLLANVELFDVFTDPTGAKIPADKKSVAYSLTYRSPERTLTADEVNAAHARLKARLQPLGVSLRE